MNKTTSRPAPRPAPKRTAPSKPAAGKPSVATKPSSGSSAGSSSSIKTGSSSGTSTSTRNGNSSFVKDPEKTTLAQENKAKEKANSFQESFLDAWGDDKTGKSEASNNSDKTSDSTSPAAELKPQDDKGIAEINGKKVPVENQGKDQPMGPLTREQAEAQKRRQVETLTGDNRDAAVEQVKALYQSAVKDPSALQTMMAGFDGADPAVQDLMLRGVQGLSKFAAGDIENRQALMEASQKSLIHIMNAPERLQQKIAANPLKNVGILGQLPPGFNAHSAQESIFKAMRGKPSDLAQTAERLKYQNPQMTDHTGLARDPRTGQVIPEAGQALNGATQEVYQDLQKMPGTLNLARTAAVSFEGTLSPDQLSAHLNKAKQNANRGDHQGEQASESLARNVDQLSSQDILRLRNNEQVRKAALKPGSESREKLINEARESNNPALKSWLTDQFSQGSMSNEKFESLNGEVGREVGNRVRDALSKNPEELKGREHLYAEYGNLLRAKEMYLSGGEYSEQVDYGQVMKRLDAVQGQLESDVLDIQKSKSNYSSVQNQEKYLASQDFQDRLRLADPAERADLAREELAKLNAFNPEAAQKLESTIQEQLGAIQIAEPSNGLALFQGQTGETQAQVVDGLLQATKDGLPITGGVAKAYSSSVNALDGVATQQITDILKGLSPQDIKNTSDLSKHFNQGLDEVRSQLQQIVDKGGEEAKDAGKALKSLGRVSQWANQFGEVGGWGTLGATLGTTSLVLGGMPENGMDAANAATGVAGVLGNLEDTAKVGTTATRAVAEKLFKAGGKFDELAKLRGVAGASNLLGKLKILGPVGDIAGGALDTYGAYQEAGKGDVHGTIGKSMTAAGGLGAGAGGALMAAGLLSNPVGWTIIGVGTVTTLAGMGYQWAYGMDEQEEFLHRMNLRRESW